VPKSNALLEERNWQRGIGREELAAIGKFFLKENKKVDENNC